MKPIIRVENLSKQYRIGKRQNSYNTLRDSFSAALRAPFARFKSNGASEEDTIWALRDVSFDVTPGEVVGIIGRNGAGKSTLLKILSRITEPTTGQVDLYGRVGSLLEVGTGFHPELSGRENIYLNGAILGMQRREIERKFDEIVAFAEIDKFIDTPVKHYSSGMYMRLAFAVAANLEPEILVVDEVLAVGDADFQKKCLGKMSEVADVGRTIFFVSHNLSAIRSLCKRALFMKEGRLHFDASANDAVDLYLQNRAEAVSEKDWEGQMFPGNENIRVKWIAVYAENKSPGDPILTSDNVVLDVLYCTGLEEVSLDVTWDIMDSQGTHVAQIGAVCRPEEKMKKGCYRTTGIVPRNILNSRRYVLSVQWGKNQQDLLYRMEDVLICNIEDNLQSRGANYNQFPGVVHPKCDWRTTPIFSDSNSND